MHYPTNRITHTKVFVTPVVEHWNEKYPNGSTMKDYFQESDPAAGSLA